MKKTLIFLMYISSTMLVFGQLPKVTGHVTDESGAPLSGVSIHIKGSSKGTITDMNGLYEIPAAATDTIVFTYIGYKPEQYVKGKNNSLNVKLIPQNQDLEEVVVIGYGTSRKKDLTGAISQVKTEDIANAAVKSIEETLGGRVAGVQVISTEGQPGAGTDIIIRGGNSITQSNAPLYVIDGFAVEDPDLSEIDPAEIESMDILKDASATAIYGSRGANGVIIINTKRGKVSKPRVTYNAYYGLQNSSKKMEVLSPYEFVRLNIDIDADKADRYFNDGKTLDSYLNVKGIDWQERLYRIAPIQSHNLSMSGGTKDNKYNLSFSYFNQDGVLIASGFERFTGRMSLDQRISTKVDVGINASYTHSVTNGTLTSQGAVTDASSYLLYNAWAYQPISSKEDFDLENEDIDPDINTDGDYRFNPVKSANNEHRWKYANTFSSNAFFNYEVIKNLTLRVAGGISRTDNKNETFYNSKTRQGKMGALKAYGSVRNDNIVRWSNENTLNYKYKDGGWSFEGLLGNSFLNYMYEHDGVLSVNVLEESLGINGLFTGTPKNIYNEANSWSLMSGFIRGFLSYRDKYLFTATYRTDGSSKFAKENRWGFFPSGSFAWRISEEEFLKAYHDISQIKLRASWGRTGNNRVGEYVSYAELANGYYPLAPETSNPSPSVFLVNLRNAGLRWETTEQTDIGLDLAFFDSRLSITMDYYHKHTRDLLLQADLPPTSTYVTAMKNVGAIQNKGFEFTLSTVPVKTRDITWKSEFNISFNRNKVLALNDQQQEMMRYVRWDTNYNDLPAYIIQVGKPLGQMYGYIWDGVYQIDDFTWQNDSDPEIPHLERNYTLKQGVANYAGAKPGDIKYKNLVGDDETINDDDRIVIGNALPDYIGGWNNVLNYKNFDFTMFMQFSVGNDVLNANRLYMERMQMSFTNQFVSVLDRWSVDNPSNVMYGPKGMRQANYSSRVIEDASFLKVRTISLGYSVPRSVLKKINIYKIRVYAMSQNLFTFTNYSGLDPEVSTKGTTITPAFDFSAYPRSKNFLIGTNITF